MLQVLRITALFLLLALTQTAQAQVLHIVDNLDDDGPGSLRQTIRDAADGDILRIWAAGVVFPDSTIHITKSITIEGPQPIHFLLNGGNLPSGSPLIEISAAGGTVIIEDISLTKPGSTGSGAVGAVKIAAGEVGFNHCAFENCQSQKGGAIYVAGGSAKTKRCSFIGNQAADGGAVYNQASYTAENCAFHNNEVSGSGNAIHNDGTLELLHNTFSENGVTASNTTAISSVSGTIAFTNNLVANNYSNGEANLSSSGTNWNSYGGNLVQSNLANITFLTPTGNDLILVTANAGLRGSIMRDGYGVQYYPIVDPASDALDLGTSIFIPTVDLRNGPRKMLSSNGGNVLTADAGCIEFTPWIVNNLDGTEPTSGPPAGSVGWAVDGVNNGGQESMIVFDLPGPTYEIVPQDRYEVFVKCNVDGYTQPNTTVPGPYDPLMGWAVVPAVPKVSFEGSISPDDCWVLRGGVGSQVSGLSVYGFTDNSAIVMKDSASFCKIWGNHIGTNTAGMQAYNNFVGILTLGSSWNVIGGRRTWHRNIACANDTAGIALAEASFFNSVLGNFVGTDVHGTSELPNGYGIYVTDTSMVNLIGDTLEARNLISGNDLAGIAFNDTTDDINTVRSNWIGVDISGQNAIPNHIGIRIGKRVSLVTVGGTEASHWNVISGNDSTGIYMAGGLNGIHGNLIGLGADGFTPVGNGSDGIYMTTSSLSTVGGLGIGRINIISGNAGHGIKVENSTLSSFYGNIIGSAIDIQGNVGNAGHGMLFGVGSSLCSIGNAANSVGNYVVSNDSSGIALINSSGGHNIIWNIIGTDTLSTTDFGNGGSGIYIDGNGIFNNIIGDTAQGGGNNIIAYNGENGITIKNSTGNRMHNNVLFLNNGLGIDLDDDGVTPNDAFDVDAGANDLENTPDITNVTACLNGTAVVGTFHGTANKPFYIEVYASAVADPSGYGEAEGLLITHFDSTDAAGNLSFSLFSSYVLPSGAVVSATATNFAPTSKNTSEFGLNKVVNTMAPPTMSPDITACDGVGGDTIWATPISGGQIYWATDASFTSILDSGTYVYPDSTVGIHTYYATELVGSCATNLDSITVTIEPLDNPAFEYDDFCATAVGTPMNVGTPGGTYNWVIDPQDGSTINTATGEITNGVGGSVYEIIYLTNSNCPNDLVISVDVLESPYIDQVTIMDETCAGAGDGSIAITASGGQTPLVYSIDNGATTSFNPVFNNLPAGSYIAVAAGTNGCYDFSIETVGTGVPNTLAVNADESICPSNSVQLEATGNGEIYWVGNDIDSFSIDPLVSPDSTTIYYATLYDGNCVFTDSVTITILDPEACGFYIFNAFSPDGDGTNETWNIRGIEDFPDNEVVIFNRWGDPVRRFEDYDNNAVVWDGKSDFGTDLPINTYYYSVVLYGSEDIHHSGWVWLAR